MAKTKIYKYSTHQHDFGKKIKSSYFWCPKRALGPPVYMGLLTKKKLGHLKKKSYHHFLVFAKKKDFSGFRGIPTTDPDKMLILIVSKHKLTEFKSHCLILSNYTFKPVSQDVPTHVMTFFSSCRPFHGKTSSACLFYTLSMSNLGNLRPKNAFKNTFEIPLKMSFIQRDKGVELHSRASCLLQAFGAYFSVTLLKKNIFKDYQTIRNLCICEKMKVLGYKVIHFSEFQLKKNPKWYSVIFRYQNQLFYFGTISNRKRKGLGYEILDPKRKFVVVSPTYKPNDDGTDSQIFISESYDATSHFETTCLDVLEVYRRGTGEDFDTSKVKHNLGEEDM
ncbi:unnamed protein product, partial [Meganyctiphanes norvegica]